MTLPRPIDLLAFLIMLGLVSVACVCLYRIATAPRPPYMPRTQSISHAGHDYLRFYDLGGVSVVHDPECEACQ